MKHIILAAVLMVASWGQPAFAGCVAEQTVSTRDCPIFTPQGDLVTKGTIKQRLNRWVILCYPSVDWKSQQERTGQKPYHVARAVSGNGGVMRSISDYQKYVDMPDAKLIQTQCYKQHYAPGWVVMTVTQCRREGFYQFLTTKVLHAADHGKTLFFHGRPDLDRYAYPVRAPG